MSADEPTWPPLLPAVGAVVGGIAFSLYLLLEPVASTPAGRPASGLEAGNPFVVGLAVVVPGLALLGLAGILGDRRRLRWGAGLALLALGLLPFALGPQVWIVGLLVVVATLLVDTDIDAVIRRLGIAVAILALAGLVALTVLTASRYQFPTAVLGFGLLAGVVLAALRALGEGRVPSPGPAAVAVAVLASGVLGAVVVTAGPTVAAPAPHLDSFEATQATCAGDDPRTGGATERPRWNRFVLTVTGSVAVPNTGYELANPVLSETGPSRYELTVDPRERGTDAIECPARIGYTATVVIPRTVESGYTLAILADGEVVQEVWNHQGGSGTRI